MIKHSLFFLVVCIGIFSCCKCKKPANGVIVGRDSVTFTRTVSRAIYDTFQIRLQKTIVRGWNIVALSEAYLKEVTVHPDRSIRQITLNTDILQNLSRGNQSIRLIPLYFDPASTYPGLKDTVILAVGYVDGDGNEHFEDVHTYFSNRDAPARYPVFCPPPRPCPVL